MTIHKRDRGGIEVVCDERGCPESYVQVTFGPEPEGWTTVEPPGMADPLHYCPQHSPSSEEDS